MKFFLELSNPETEEEAGNGCTHAMCMLSEGNSLHLPSSPCQHFSINRVGAALKHLSHAPEYSLDVHMDSAGHKPYIISSDGSPEPFSMCDISFIEHQILSMPNLQIKPPDCCPHDSAVKSANLQEASSDFSMSGWELNSQGHTSFVSTPGSETYLSGQSSAIGTTPSQFHTYSDNVGLLGMSAFFPSELSSTQSCEPYPSVPVNHLVADDDEKDMRSIQSLVTQLDKQPSECCVLNKSSSTHLLGDQGNPGAMDRRAKFPSSVVSQSLDMPTGSPSMLSNAMNEPMIVSSTNSSMVSSTLSSSAPMMMMMMTKVNATHKASSAPMMMMLPTKEHSLQTYSDEAAAMEAWPKRGRFLEAVMRAGPLLQQLLVTGPLPDWNNPPPMVDIPVVPVPCKAVPHTYRMT